MVGHRLRTSAWAWLALVPAAGLAGCDRPDETRPPNVVLVSADTLRADALNCYGYRDHVVSPHLDALARDGILFESFIAASPWTTPSHMSLVTSLHPTSHGIVQPFSTLMLRMRMGKGYDRLADDRITLAEVLRDNGYETAAFTGGITLDPAIGFDQGFDRYETSMYKLDERNMGAMFEWIVANEARPFFLFFHTFEVHAPYLHGDFLPDEHAALRTALAARIGDLTSASATSEQHKGHNDMMRRLLVDRDAWDPRITRAMYGGGVRSFDGWLGRLVETLRERGLYDDTLIVFVSDHGDEFADHDPAHFYDMHGHTLYEELVRVPLIIKLPGGEHAGTRVRPVARGVDVMPTIVDLLDLAPPGPVMQGLSLEPLWDGGTNPRPRVAFCEASALPNELKCVRTARYKYIVDVPASSVSENGRAWLPEQIETRLLFDLQSDPFERTNLLAGEPSATVQALVAALDTRLRGFLNEDAAETEEVFLDEETIRKLRALGYLE